MEMESNDLKIQSTKINLLMLGLTSKEVENYEQKAFSKAIQQLQLSNSEYVLKELESLENQVKLKGIKTDQTSEKQTENHRLNINFTVDLSRFSQALQEAHEKLQDFIPIDWQAYYAEQQRIADDWRWQTDPLEIKQHLQVIWDEILCNAADLFHLLGYICDDLGDRLYPYN